MKIANIILAMKNKPTHHTVYKEQGRSMVEMLGVLAIIGVLSIGGIAGYTMAMNRYKANQILDLASKMSMALHTAAASNPEIYETTAQVFSETVDTIFGELGILSYGSSSGMGEAYETTFHLYEDGSVKVYTKKQSLQNAIDSVVGVEGVGQGRNYIVEVE